MATIKKPKSRQQRSDPLADKISTKQPEEPYERIDGRTLRRTGRTIPFGTRVSPQFDQQLRSIAQREGISLTEVLERALELYATRKAGE